ncbi:hypothetical protein DEU35_0526 [Microbacterium sp. AG157]|uniref:hypothetical protein n=1 Tax=Microbacterium sp. AG157 TaxID=2183993 RepID=UPI000E24AF31|nr:hypothetical protein [Microbacterium sp. AG157]REC99551.1 hypothetical protein DEU35_0526 [Microbacterium sp. AG157]
MKNAIDAAVPSSLRRARVVLPVLLVAGVLAFSGCASTSGSATPSPTETAASATPTASPTSSEAPSPTTAPTAGGSDATDAPFNGQILIITSEVRDGALQVSAMVPGVSESGGTCTLTLVSTGAKVESTANEGKDVTYCGLMSIAVGDSSADPAFQVAYSSRTTSAKSAVTTVEPTS